MTIEQAEKLRKLLNYRDSLKLTLDEIHNCTCAYGTISDGTNGRPFRWDRKSYLGDRIGEVCLKSIENGLFEEIAVIERTIETCYSSSEEVN